jgi:hypothetical protein
VNQLRHVLGPVAAAKLAWSNRDPGLFGKLVAG